MLLRQCRPRAVHICASTRNGEQRFEEESKDDGEIQYDDIIEGLHRQAYDTRHARRPQVACATARRGHQGALEDAG